MTGAINERLISRIGNRGERRSRPRATALEPEVRTPIGLVPVAPPTDDDRLDLPPIQPLDPGKPLLGPFLFQWRYNVRFEHIHTFHDWLMTYEQRLQQICPRHFRYLGTFAAPFGANGQLRSGQYCTLWQHAHHGGVLHLRFGKGEKQKLTKELGSEKDFCRQEDEFLRLLRELMSFQDESSPIRESQLYQLATNIGRV